MSTYIPTPGSLAADVCDYLRDHRNVLELSILQMTRIWPDKAKTSNVNPCLATPVTHRLLDRARNERGELVYRRGRAFDGEMPQASMPAAPAPVAAPAAAASPAQAAAPAPVATPPARRPGPSLGGAVARLPELDLTKLVVRVDIPVPVAPPRPGHSRYDEIFNRLAAVGHSLFLPREYLGAVKQAAKKYSKRTGRHVMAYAIPEQPDKCGVWRIAPPADKGTTSTPRSAA